jgi:hypothetical protein
MEKPVNRDKKSNLYLIFVVAIALAGFFARYLHFGWGISLWSELIVFSSSAMFLVLMLYQIVFRTKLIVFENPNKLVFLSILSIIAFLSTLFSSYLGLEWDIPVWSMLLIGIALIPSLTICVYGIVFRSQALLAKNNSVS